jgi:hypothetical protein
MRLAVRPRGTALASGALAVPLWVACGAGSPSGATVTSAHAPTAVCQKVPGVISDGPDPDADPVGAVSTTLRSLVRADPALVTSDRPLHKARPGVAS